MPIGASGTRQCWIPDVTRGRMPVLHSGFTACLLIKDSDRAIVQGFRVCVRITNGGHPCPSQLAQGAHHVKHHACLAELAKMQVVPHDNIEQVVRSKSPIARRLNVIAGYKELLLTIRSREDPSLRIVGSIGKKLQSQNRMSGAAFS